MACQAGMPYRQAPASTSQNETISTLPWFRTREVKNSEVLKFGLFKIQFERVGGDPVRDRATPILSQDPCARVEYWPDAPERAQDPNKTRTGQKSEFLLDRLPRMWYGCSRC